MSQQHFRELIADLTSRIARRALVLLFCLLPEGQIDFTRASA